MPPKINKETKAIQKAKAYADRTTALQQTAPQQTEQPEQPLSQPAGYAGIRFLTPNSNALHALDPHSTPADDKWLGPVNLQDKHKPLSSVQRPITALTAAANSSSSTSAHEAWTTIPFNAGVIAASSGFPKMSIEMYRPDGPGDGDSWNPTSSVDSCSTEDSTISEQDFIDGMMFPFNVKELPFVSIKKRSSGGDGPTTRALSDAVTRWDNSVPPKERDNRSFIQKFVESGSMAEQQQNAKVAHRATGFRFKIMSCNTHGKLDHLSSDANPVSVEINPDDWPGLAATLKDCVINANSRSLLSGDDDEFLVRLGENVEVSSEETPDMSATDAVTQTIQLQREIYGLLLGQLLPIGEELRQYEWKQFRESIKRNFHVSSGPPKFLRTSDERSRFVQVLNELYSDGLQDKMRADTGSKISQFTSRCTINPAFLEMKRTKATRIHLKSKEQFCILLLIIYADIIHDAKRLEDDAFKKKFIKFIQQNAGNLVAKMYNIHDSSQSPPQGIADLLSIIQKPNPVSIEDELMTFIEGHGTLLGTEIITALRATPLADYYKTRIFTNNACCDDAVNDTNIVSSLPSIVDAGSSGGNFGIIGLRNVEFRYSPEDTDEFYSLLMCNCISKPNIKIKSSERVRCFAIDEIINLQWNTGTSSITHNATDFQRLPFCDEQGSMKGWFSDIRLDNVAKRIWMKKIELSSVRPNGFDVLPCAAFKYIGDGGQVLDTLLEVNGGRKPFIVCSDTPPHTYMGGSQPLVVDPAICTKHNNIVNKYNRGRVLTREEDELFQNMLSKLDSRTIAQNDRPAHANFIAIMCMGLDCATQSFLPLLRKTPTGDSSRQATPHIAVKINCHELLNCSGTKLTQVVTDSSKPKGTSKKHVLQISSIQLKQTEPRERKQDYVFNGECADSREEFSESQRSNFTDTSKVSDSYMVSIASPYFPFSNRNQLMSPKGNSAVRNSQNLGSSEDEGNASDNSPPASGTKRSSDDPRRLLLQKSDSESDSESVSGIDGGSLRKKSIRKRSVKLQRHNNRRTQYISKKKRLSIKKKYSITKKTKNSNTKPKNTKKRKSN